jgi:hypothetical protein
MSDPVDVMKPWSIKSVATRTQSIATAAARRENLTVGQWLEKRIDEWEAQGSPEPRPAATISDLAALLTAAGAMAQHTKLPGAVRTLINETARRAQGLPAQKPGHTGARKITDETDTG